MEFTLLIAAALAVAAVWSTARRENEAWDIAVAAIAGGLIVGRAWAMLADGVNPIANPIEALVVRGGVDTVGASLGATATVTWFSRRNLWQTADALAVPALTGLAVWQAACVVRGTCLGTVTELPWGISATSGGPPRHPVEIYAAVGLGALAVVAVWARRRGFVPGVLAGFAVASAGLVRLLTEPMRPRLGRGLGWWYWTVVVAGGLLVLARHFLGRARTDT